MAKTVSDFDRARALTDNADYVPGDQTGYRVLPVNLDLGPDDDYQPVLYIVEHEYTGMGLGCFPTLERVDRAISVHQRSISGLADDELSFTAAAARPLPEYELQPSVDFTGPGYENGQPVDQQVAPDAEPAPAQ